MLTQDFINTSLPTLGENDLVKEALRTMCQFRTEHLTVCINDNYGIISYKDLQLLPEQTALKKVEKRLHKVALSSKEHIWLCLDSFNQFKTDVLPLVDENGDFCGSIILRDVINHISKIFPIGNGGAIIELEMSYQNYSIQELGGIVEGSNTKITLLSVFPIEGTTMVNVVFSIDKNDATDVIQALERHGYHVNAWFMKEGKMDNILEERYDALMTYINV